LRPLFTILLLALLGGPAFAGPREDTLAGISRCAGLPDDRTFLDCIYGAAQPMRAALGLSPALPAQQRLVPPADPGLARAAFPPQAGVQNTASNAGGGGWFSKSSGPSLRMSAYSFDRRGLFTVTLSDGSVWRQDANDTNFAHFGGPASSYPVSILETDIPGKSRLDVRGENGPYLVVRVR
jgi:hypothetical protein